MSDSISLNYTRTLDRLSVYKSFYKEKQIKDDALHFDTSKSIIENLKTLSVASLDASLTSASLFSLEEIFLDLISRWISDETTELQYAQIKQLTLSIKGSCILSALGRIVSLAPEIAPLLEFYLDRNDIFAQIEANLNSICEKELREVLLAFYRLLFADQSRFIRFVSPTVLSNILRSKHNNVNKFLSVQLLSKYLSLAEKAKNDILNNFVGDCDLKSDYETDKGIDYRFLSILEAKRLSNFASLKTISFSENTASDTFISIEASALSPFVVSVCGVLVPKIHFDQAITKSVDFVPTQRSIDALRQLSTHVQHSSPVMLVGCAGSGKTFLINELAKYLACDKSMVKIHLGEQTDAKLLLGTYTSGEKPGTFEWRHGVLTTAVKEGRWVLIEDIDKAPTEVLSILLSLLEKRELTIPSRGEIIKAANGFQLISTIRTSSDLKKATIPDLIGLRLWKILKLEDPVEDELSAILTAKFPVLHNMIPMFLKLYGSIQATYNSKSFLILNKGSHPRVISVSDLMKFCNRVSAIFQNNGITSTDQLLESSIIDSIFAEAVDCFASAIAEEAALDPLVNAIGEALQVPSSRIQVFIRKHVPVYEDYEDRLVIGRAHLKKAPSSLYRKKSTGNNTSFARTNHSLRLMEQIGVGIQMTEPLLLVGETGTGKTTVVQQVAKQMNKEITVINVSQQTETGDLLGGYKPMNTKTIAVPIQDEFTNLFRLTFASKKNKEFEEKLAKAFNRSQWKNVVACWKAAVKLAKKALVNVDDMSEAPKKKRRNDKTVLLAKWKEFDASIKNFETQAQNMDNSFVFNFVEGSLVKAVRNGDWLLLDEINLASPDTLESISDLLSHASSQRSILLSEKGEVESIQAHKDFRIFACMNPATDVGKRDLPLSIRSRFTEVYVHSPDNDIADLLQIIDKYIARFAVSDEWAGNDVASLYLEAKKLAESNQIVDGANQKPHFSIRTLTRTLLYVCDIVSIYGLRRSLYEGFCMSFLTLLDQKSEDILKPLIEKYTIGKLANAKSVVSQIPPAPSAEQGSFVQFKHYWMKQGPFNVVEDAKYIITPFVEKNMLNLVRATSGKRFPILVQGPTSAGKTSMIKYLADITGNKFVRINNHEHTDLQEYLGTYVSDDTGKLTFKEGVLVEALRKGYWLVLDELNLAPTDVLEALNRLLDDNRELFIPETQEVVHPHPDFMLFATQNPPGLYGGRKVLSRAFRNRFLELHFDDIPQSELEVILRERCQIAPSYAKKIVEVYRQLSIQRQSSRLFEQKNSFATLRDLFRWALREAVGYEQLAANGYMLLAERVRKPEERLVVKETLEKVMRVKLDMDAYYASLENHELMKVDSPVVWTKAIRRLAVLISTCLANNEPVLLVGETGCGKTTVCQILAQFQGKKLITVNAHQNTETGDLLGAQRPVRNKSEIQKNLTGMVMSALDSLDVSYDGLNFEELLELYDSTETSALPEDIQSSIASAKAGLNVLFEWTDGPLIQALNTGNYFLLDEISLADDSVLERLNSVLEPERSLLLAEKGADDSFITASDGFQFLSTMNPGGDYGKKELSPALRNRFTEIWVPSMEDFSDVQTIVESKLKPELASIAPVIVQFSENFGRQLGGGNISSGVISLRDILAWVEFTNTSFESTGDVNASLCHGAAMVFIDALGTNNTAHFAESEEKLRQKKLDCVKELSELVGQDLTDYYTGSVSISVDDKHLTAGLYKVERDLSRASEELFSFEAPTTAANAMRVVRAMQVKKPILLEGSPGVGKTSLVSALAKATGNPLTRINLSEQTDLVDLFGSDAPVEGGKTGEFVWRDAPFLRAMKEGEWVLLDEMNLASQSVLEGLNACLDHRGEAYIPELDNSFPRHPNFMVFAAQNPQYQGGGRKGLPKSFVNRFTVVYVDTLTADDLVLIAHHIYPQISSDICTKMISVVSKLEDEICVKKAWGSSGGPWEFNLRDTLRWLELYNSPSLSGTLSPVDFLNIIIVQRFRTQEDRSKAKALVEDVFDDFITDENLFVFGDQYIQSRKAVLKRSDHLQLTSHNNLCHLQSNSSILESSMLALQHNWPVILVGPSNAGKTDLVRYLATVSGSKVVEFAMNSDVDSMDILGGYEQLDLTRQVTAIVSKLSVAIATLLVSHFRNSDQVLDSTVGCLSLFAFLTKTHITLDNFDELMSKFRAFKDSVSFVSEVSELDEQLTSLSERIKEAEAVRFEWFDGLLVKAVEQGHWLVLDNANLCSPSVLDRLNSLLEINGSLIINECSLADGQPRVLKPHKNFRLFLTVDPKFGELSRAMRNRGVELFVPALGDRSTAFDCELLGFSDSVKVEVEPTLEKLDLNASNTIPSSAYIDTGDSNARSLALLIDTLANCKDISVSLATITPFIIQSHLEKFGDLCAQSSEFASEFPDQINGVAKYLNQFSDMGLTEALFDAYSKVSSNADVLAGTAVNFTTYQFLNPLWNAYVVHALSGGTHVSASELIYLFEVSAKTLDSLEKLKVVELKGSNGKISELSYVEQNAAVVSGRNVKGAPRLNIYKLLKQILEYVHLTLKDLTIEVVMSSTGILRSLDALMTIWNSLLESSSIKNEAKTRVYQKLMRKWAADTSKVATIESFTALLNTFEQDLALKRGLLMTPVWEKFRGTYPATANAWADQDDLLTLVGQFEKVAHQQYADADDLVSSLVSAILGLNNAIVNGDLSDTSTVFDSLKSGLEKLQGSSSKFLVARSHNFQESFELLFNFVVADKRSVDDELIKLAHYAGIGASTLLVMENDVYPRLFNALWAKTNSGYVSKTPGYFTGKFMETVFLNTGNYHDFSADQLDQTVSDSLFFLRQLLVNSGSVISDKVSAQKQVILKWYKDVLSLVQPSAADLALDEFVSQAKSLTLSADDTFFVSVAEMTFVPMIEVLETATNIELIGRAWVLFAIGMIQLYSPDSAFDPAIEDHIVYDNFEQRKKACESLSAAIKTIRSVHFGDDAIFLEGALPTVNDDDIPSKPRVFRSKVSIDGLFEEWQAFIQSTLETKAMENLTTQYHAIELELFEKQVELFQQNSSNFIERLCNKFTTFSDVNDIFRGYIFALKLGFDLILESKREKSAKYQLTPLWFVNSQMLTNPHTCMNGVDMFNKLAKGVDVDSSMGEQALRFMLNLLVGTNGKSALLSSESQHVFQSLYYRWSLRRTREEKKAAEEGSLFKYHDDSESDEEFKKMFPDYDEFVDVDSGLVLKSANTLEEEAAAFAQSYTAILLDDKANVTLKNLIDEGTIVAKRVLESDGTNFSSGSIDTATIVSIVQKLSESIDTARVASKSDDIDFYRGYSPSELKRSTGVIERLLSAVSALLEQWPEHATLQTLDRICREYLAFPVRTTIARLIQKVEQIYTFIAEWEKYASSKVTLKQNFDEMTGLIVSWRRLELSSWKSLFDHEDKIREQNIGKWWFNLFEIVILPLYTDDEDLDLLKLVSSLNLFISKSTYGEYLSRLNLLKAFAVHVSLIAPKHLLNNTLKNMVSYYEQFLPLVQEKLDEGRKKLQKDVQEVILLASWKDVNIDALKQSARRSHQALYKLVRKYRDLLSIDVYPLVEQGIPSSEKVTLPTGSVGYKPSHVDIQTVIESCDSVSEWVSRPNHLKNGFLINSNMSVYKEKVKSREYPSLYEYATELCEEMESLKKETPNVYNEENKKAIAALKTQKMKLLSDTLKELKRIGLKSHLREDIHKLQSSATLILSESVSFRETVVEGSDSYFFRLIDLLPRLRASVSAVAEDVSPVDAEKGLAIVENLVYYLIKNKKPLFQLSKAYQRIRDVQTKLEDVLKDDEEQFIPQENIDLSLSQAKTLLKWLPQILDSAIDTGSIASRLGQIPVDTTVFTNIRATAVEIAASLETPWSYTTTMSERLILLPSHLSGFVADIEKWKLSHQSLSFIGDYVIHWIQTAALTEPVTTANDVVDVAVLDEKLRKLSGRVLVVFQKITKSLSENPFVFEDDKWFTSTQKELTEATKCLHSEAVTKSFEELVNLLSNLFSVGVSGVKPLLKFTMIFLNNYIELLVTVLNKLRDNYHDVSRSTYVFSTTLFNLSKDGFCSPEAPSESKESDNLQDGTGLGDGEGANNTSNDVEDDEDLSEQAQEPNKDEDQNKEEDENDDAVDIDGDMAGNLENLSDQEKSDDEEDDEGDEEELDEEIDDLDDLDPNAVDDKMWDEEAKEDKKEKESDTMPENSASDDVQAKEDEEETGESKNEKNDNNSNEENPDEEENENDEEGDEEEDVGQQDDEVKNEENEELDQNVPETETLELPEDMNLDDDEEGGDEKEQEEEEAGPDDNMDDAMDVDEPEQEDGKDDDIDVSKDDKDEDQNENEEPQEEEDMDIATNEDQEDGHDDENPEGEDEQEAIEAAEDSGDEDLKENQGGEDENDDGEDQEDGDQIEGLDGADTGENDEEIDQDTAVEQASGSRGQGSQAQDDQEQEDVGASGSASHQQDQNDDSKDQSNDANRDDVKESLKQLGDSLKEFHRRHQEIMEANEKDDMAEQKAGERPDEFEHVDGENTETDTQALGAANKDQVSAIDDEMAIDDDDDDEENKVGEDDVKKEEDGEEADEDLENVGESKDEQPEEFNGKTKGGFIGERKQEFDEDEEMLHAEFDDEDDEDDELDGTVVKTEPLTEDSPFCDIDEARDLWRKSELETQDLAASLCEQLRLILEPTLSTKLKGDYKTGKRLNMKRIIPYIASDFRKDKIWLRRTKPSKRQYQIMIAVDDSKSMSESKSVDLAFQSICLVSKALTQLESGGLSIVKFGENTNVVHPFDKQFSPETGAQIFQRFDFQQTRTDIKKLVNESIEIFNTARSLGNADLWQLQIIISDGVCEDHATIQRLVRRAREEKIMLVFVIIDGINSNESIMDMSQVKYVPDAQGNMVLKVDKYLDSFPFEFYVVVHDIAELPKMLSLILRQYFSELASN